jgi:hypothetical protein
MLRGGEERLNGIRLDNRARIHHRNTVAERTDEAEVVGDEENGKLLIGGEPAQGFHDLRLNRHVERGRRLVSDQEFRLAGNGKCDHDPLQLLERGNENASRLGDANPPLPRNDFGQLGADGEVRIERCPGVLEDHRRPSAAHGSKDCRFRADDLSSADLHAPGHLAESRHHTQQRQRSERLAAPGLTDQTKHLALFHLERHVIDDVQLAVARREANVEM